MKINYRILNNFSPKKLSFLRIYRFTCNNCCQMEKNAPAWEQPQMKPDTYITGLKVNNSLAPGKLVISLFFHFIILAIFKKNFIIIFYI